MSVRIVPLSLCAPREIRMVFMWRSNPFVSQQMGYDEPLTFTDHMRHVAWVRHRDDVFCYLVYQKGIPQGVISLYIQKNSVAEAGVYKNPDLQKQGGVGFFLMQLLMDEAERRLVQRLVLRVLVTNRTAQKLYEKCGFVPFQRDDTEILYIRTMCGVSHDRA
ncbi:GNAT family N-acetyltransferase [Chitinivibrio alkaliphilus]|uniref:GNAT family acetyltransferase n=1 Tax=Chitinivibrio alkaliphilus ACht1 TaxID=1313304 RepID=U7D631_9BACT|nr:GNAT family N-acetyltransferase [Chitinivibrio alkaliphilus]ERP31036.1 GNAT family acetyltransferase [Chitinivibrio alkaliphilus ACht1]